MAFSEVETIHTELLPSNVDQYTMSESELLRSTLELTAGAKPYIYDGAVFGEDVIEGFDFDSAIYVVDGESDYAKIARTLEARVEETDKNWLQDPVTTAKYHEPIEGGCEFFIFVSGVSSDLPKAVGSMRIMNLADGIKGAAQHNFEIANLDTVVPERLGKMSEDENVIDIADIVVRPEFRLSGLNVSAWLNHCLNRIGDERGVDRLVSCMNDQEAKLLRLQGISFEQVGDYAAEYDDDGSVYRFYDVDVKALRAKLEESTERLLQQRGVQKAIGSRALIASKGTAVTAKE